MTNGIYRNFSHRTSKKGLQNDVKITPQNQVWKRGSKKGLQNDVKIDEIDGLKNHVLMGFYAVFEILGEKVLEKKWLSKWPDFRNFTPKYVNHDNSRSSEPFGSEKSALKIDQNHRFKTRRSFDQNHTIFRPHFEVRFGPTFSSKWLWRTRIVVISTIGPPKSGLQNDPQNRPKPRFRQKSVFARLWSLISNCGERSEMDREIVQKSSKSTIFDDFEGTKMRFCPLGWCHLAS